jgi:hypothetical protein
MFTFRPEDMDIKKLLPFALALPLVSGGGVAGDLAAALVSPKPIAPTASEFLISESLDVPAATIFSEKVHKGIALPPLEMERKKVVEKQKKFPGTPILVTKNATSGIPYTFYGGLVPQKNLNANEIDLLKIFGLSTGDSRRQFAALMENPKSIKEKTFKKFKLIYQNFLQEIDKYITFFEEKLDGIFREHAKKLHAQFRVLADQFRSGLRRLHASDAADHMKKVVALTLDLPGNPPLNTLQELFQPELILLFAIHNDVVVDGFHFGTLAQQNPLILCLDRDMDLTSETLWAWLSNRTERSDKLIIVFSIDVSKQPTRFPNSPFLHYIYVPNFIKAPLRKVEP